MKEELDFYEGYSSDPSQDREIEGITGTVTDYTFSKLEFPCLILKENASFPEHKLMVVSNMVKVKSNSSKINIYFKDGSDLFSIGAIVGSQVMSFIELLGEENLEGYLNSDTKVTGSNLYALSMMNF